jgi:2-oxoglutarate ferredoxin oxidoreductase subunit alpha
MGHGDTQHVILLPGSVNECFEFGWRAFDLAERLQAPVFVLSDLDFGMNQWMTAPFVYPDQPMDRGKVLWEADLDHLNGNWGRYRDLDGDGIPYRTIPGNRNPRAAYFARGTGHDERADYSEDPENWNKLLARLKQKYETARTLVPGPKVERMDGAEVGIIAFGSTEPAINEARDQLARGGISTDFLRVRAVPFSQEVSDFVETHRRSYVVEMNRDGQLHQLLTIDYPAQATRLVSLAHTDGLPLTARRVVDAVMKHEEMER